MILEAGSDVGKGATEGGISFFFPSRPFYGGEEGKSGREGHVAVQHGHGFRLQQQPCLVRNPEGREGGKRRGEGEEMRLSLAVSVCMSCLGVFSFRSPREGFFSAKKEKACSSSKTEIK